MGIGGSQLESTIHTLYSDFNGLPNDISRRLGHLLTLSISVLGLVAHPKPFITHRRCCSTFNLAGHIERAAERWGGTC